MTRTGRLVWVAALAAGLTIASPAWAQTLFTGSELSVDDAETVAAEAYRRLEERAAAAGSDLRFRLSDFRTLERYELDTAPWLDLVTMPGDAMIDVHRAELTKSYQGFAPETRVEYRVSWKDDGEEYLLTDEGSRLAALTAEEVLVEAGREQPEYGEVGAITSYAVTATLDGHERAYRAALLWTPGTTASGTALIFMDHITQGVQEAAIEPLAAITPAWRAETPPKPTQVAPGRDSKNGGTQELAPGGEPYPTQCVPFWPSPISTPFTVQRATDHFYGYHALIGGFTSECRCTLNCASFCRLTVPSLDCVETGSHYSACHKRGTSSMGSQTSGYGGGDTCSAGAACGVTPCLFCLCGVTVQVQIIGTKVTFSGGGTLDTMTRQATQTCPPCAVVEPCGEPQPHATPHPPRL